MPLVADAFKPNNPATQTLLLVFIPTSKSHVAFLPWYLYRGGICCLSYAAQSLKYKKTHKKEF